MSTASMATEDKVDKLDSIETVNASLLMAIRDVITQELREFGIRQQDELLAEIRKALSWVEEPRHNTADRLDPNTIRSSAQRFLRPTHSAEDAEVAAPQAAAQPGGQQQQQQHQQQPQQPHLARDRFSGRSDRSLSRDSNAQPPPVQVALCGGAPPGHNMAGSAMAESFSQNSSPRIRPYFKGFPHLQTASDISSANEANDLLSSGEEKEVSSQAKSLSPVACHTTTNNSLRVSMSAGGKKQSATQRRISVNSSLSKLTHSSAAQRCATGILPVVPGHVAIDTMQGVNYDRRDETSQQLLYGPTTTTAALLPQEGSRFQRMVRSTSFDNIICVFIILNGIIIGLETEWEIQHLGSSKPVFFSILNVCFCIVYMSELALQLGAEGWEFFTSSAWNYYDVIAVLCQIGSLIMEGFDSVTMPNLSCVVLLRLFRLSRFLRLIRLCRTMVPLIVWTSIVTSLRYMIWVVLFLLFVIYVGGVVVTTLVADHGRKHPDIMTSNSRIDQYYSSLGYSLLSLFQAMTGGVDWDDLVRPLMTEISPLVAIVFSLYICFSVLCVANVITGIFVDSALESGRAAKGKEVEREVLGLFCSTDADGNGTITWSEFALALGSPNMEQCLRAMDIDPAEARGIFTLLDTEDRGEIDSQEFVSGCLRLRGQARAIDLATLMYFNKRIATWWFQKMQLVEDRLANIADLLDPNSNNLRRGSSMWESNSKREDVRRASTPVTEDAMSPPSCPLPATIPEAPARRRSLAEGGMTPGVASSVNPPSFFATWTELKAEADRRVNELRHADPTLSTQSARYARRTKV